MAANTLRFGPVRQDVEWDGESFARVTVAARCVNTSATHTVSVVQVFTANQTDFPGGVETVFRQGDPVVYRLAAQSPEVSPTFTLPASVATTGEVSFSLTDSTGWVFVLTPTESLAFPLNFRDTTDPRYFQYRVDQEVGTTKTVLSVGLITRLPVNVIRQSVTVSTGGGTAQQCPA